MRANQDVDVWSGGAGQRSGDEHCAGEQTISPRR